MASRRCLSPLGGVDPVTSPDAAAEPVTRHGVPTSLSRGQEVLHPSADDYLRVVEALFDEGFLVCVDVTAVDYLTYGSARDLPAGVDPQRFELVVNLLSHRDRSRVRLRVQLPAEAPEIASITHRYPGAEASEREVFDMFGISFTDHPDLTRIVMPEDWTGHPLRKDYDSGRIPVQFKGPAPAR